MYSDSKTTVTYYDDGNNIYRLVSGPFSGQEQWYITTGREWPGTYGMEYPECRTIVNGLIETGKEIMDYAVANGIMNLTEAATKYEMSKNQSYLDQHPYAITHNEGDAFWRTTFKDATKGRIYVKKRTKEELEQCIIAHYKGLKKITVEEAMTEAINHHYRSSKSAPTKERSLQDMKRFYSTIYQKDILSMSEYDWADYLDEMVTLVHPKKRAFTNACTLLRLTLKRLKQQRLSDININTIFDVLETNEDDFDKSKKEVKNEVFSTAESKKLIPYLWENRSDPQCLMLLLMYVTGMRIGESTTLKHSDIEGNVIHIKRSASGSYRDEGGELHQTRVKNDGEAKTKASLRNIIVPQGADDVLNAVKALSPESEFIFTNKDGEVFSRSAMNHKLGRICKKLEIEHKSTHVRKTYLSILDDNSVSSATIISLAGHTDFSITEQHYIKNTHDSDEIRETLNKVSGLDITTYVNA